MIQLRETKKFLQSEEKKKINQNMFHSYCCDHNETQLSITEVQLPDQQPITPSLLWAVCQSPFLKDESDAKTQYWCVLGLTSQEQTH